MAEWHLAELEHALERRGWRVVERRPGEGHGVSATWAIERGDTRLLLDFEGLNDLETLPIEHAYGVDVRGREHGLYFGKRPTPARPNRAWNDELAEFVDALGHASQKR